MSTQDPPPRLPRPRRRFIIVQPGRGTLPSGDATTWSTTLHLLPDVGAFYEEYAAQRGLSADTLLTLIAMGMVAVLRDQGMQP